MISWNTKQPFINGFFNWMIPNLYIGNGCLGFQVDDCFFFPGVYDEGSCSPFFG